MSYEFKIQKEKGNGNREMANVKREKTIITSLFWF